MDPGANTPRDKRTSITRVKVTSIHYLDNHTTPALLLRVMNVCVPVCTCMYVGVYVCTRVCGCTPVCVCVHVHTSMYACVCMSVHVCVCTYVITRICVWMNTHHPNTSFHVYFSIHTFSHYYQ